MAVSVEMTGDEVKLFRSLQKVVTQQNKMSAGLRKISSESRAASRSQNKAFGAQSLSSLKSYAAGVVSIGAGIAAAKSALSAFLDVQKGAAQGVESVDDKVRKLIQISGGKKGRFEELKALSQGLQRKEGFKQDRALDFIFSGVSLGFSDEEIKRFGRIRQVEKRDPVSVLEGVAGIRAAFGKEALGGTGDKQLSALLTAAAKSKVGLAEIAKASLVPLQSIKSLGGTDVETLAAVSVASGALPSTEEASTAVARLADVLGKNKKFRGKGLLQNLRDLSGLTEEEKITQFGGNVRAKRGLDVLLARLPELQQTATDIQEAIRKGGTAEGAFRGALDLAGGDTDLGATAGKDRTDAAKRLAEQGSFALKQIQRDQVRGLLDSILADPKLDVGAIRRAAISAELGVAELLGEAPDAFARRAAKIAGLLGFGPEDSHFLPTSPAANREGADLFLKMLEEIRRGNDIAERTAQGLEGRTTTLGVGPGEDR